MRWEEVCRDRIEHNSCQSEFFVYENVKMFMLLLQIFRKYEVGYSGKLVYKVNSTYIPESPLNFKLMERPE